jgi:hypothetical protein
MNPLIRHGDRLVIHSPTEEIAMKQPNTKKPESGELSDTALNQASGGALNAYTPAPTDSTHGTGGGTGKTVAGDGSVRTSSLLIGL